ncbi:M36 family metallopeptidase [Pseudalkalibacillus caeni]|uniref:Coagulation factor 5/8 type-like protein n=1 Tax=Exobacillus caeni TaxID=2574798 RepID=A0A5R9F6N8_9BACL|nr:M36 family metallopeptidase [Pseudalkalibacillus caeni]TLS36493.1 coagulation factor 5/8 type-like protein [Pseudalkalibacillus caeni]
MGKMFRTFSALTLTIPLLFAGSPAEALIGSNHTSHSTDQVNDDSRSFDVRNVLNRVLPTEDQLKAARSFIDSAGSGTKVDWNPLFGTPSTIIKEKGYLTAPSDLDAETIARNWLKNNAGMFGLSSTEIDSLAVIRSYEMPGTGLNPVTFQQTFDGIGSVYGGRVIVAVNKDGQILSVTGNMSRSKTLTGEFQLTSADALNQAIKLEAKTLEFNPTLTGTEKGWDVFDGGGVLPTKQRVKKAAFITEDGVRPAFRVLFIEELDKGYEIVIDAESGEQLYKRSLVDHLLDPEGLVFENYPGAAKGGTQVVKSFKGDPKASPNGWLIPGTNLGVTTFGNNANSYANWSNFLVPADEAVRPVAPLGEFSFTFKNSWQETEGQTVPPSYADDVNSAATSLFYHHNLFHDYYYNLGWVEAAGNLQLSNFGKGGVDGDAVLGLVQAGAVSGGDPTYTGRDNAYMLTLPDGIPAWSGMFLWEPIAGAFNGEYADGDFDAGVIYHEYTHALSNRMVAGGEALGSHQAGSMGEGWGDWYGMHYLMKKGLQDKPVVGAYVTGNDERGIRSYSLDEAPYNYGDIGYDIVGPEVHADGDIWAAILWHMRDSLISEFGKTEGESVSEQLVIDAMPISVPDPSMEDMRTAIIAADFERYGGKHYETLWSAFAQRGLGADAYSNGGDDTEPIPAFNHPDGQLNGQIVGKVVNASTNKPIADARIIVGEFEARTSPVAVTGEKGKFGTYMVEGTYDITIQAKGFGSRTLRDISIKAGEKNKLTFKLEPNLASSFNGASIANVSGTSDSNPVKFAIDDTEASVYASDTQENGFKGAEFVVDLAGDKPVEISHIQLSAFNDVSKSRFATLKDYSIQVSTNGDNWITVKRDAFDAQKPRPTVADLHYQGIDLENPVEAKYLKVIAHSAQDNSKGYVQIAEVQAFSSDRTRIEPLTLEPEEPFVAGGTVQVGNAGTGIGSLAGVPATLAVTENEFVTTQNPEPTSQGVDGYVITLPEQYADGIHNFTLDGSGDSEYDYDIYFYNKNFEAIGGVATAGANESGVIPGGTKYVYVGLYSGANVPFTFTAVSPY